MHRNFEKFFTEKDNFLQKEILLIFLQQTVAWFEWIISK